MGGTLPLALSRHTGSAKGLGKETSSFEWRKYPISNLRGCHRSRVGIRLDNRREEEEQQKKKALK